MPRLISFAALSICLLLAFAPVVRAQRPEPRLPEGVKAHRDLAYVENGHERQKLDLYVPEGEGPLPLVVQEGCVLFFLKPG